ncbi:hypothetical protein GA0070564_102379 [Micromonospora mirobrigensis]|uniref:Uncharacterized protein n=1 Tax=Micromonospora mirobrigensis TaxID=262898 RepID=A0A1C4WMG0_9ACTN|nr:hypothetical protein GA0070564_102379 [Micromonospora mirobrigensis]
MVRPKPGDLLRIDGRASVQFAGDRTLNLRVVSVSDLPTYHGWLWVTGYVIDRRGRATTKREIYVQLAGLRPTADSNLGPAGGPATSAGPPATSQEVATVRPAAIRSMAATVPSSGRRSGRE